MKKPKARPKPKTKCFYFKGNGHWKGNCPKCLADKKDGKVNKGIFDIHVIEVYFTCVYNNTTVFDTGSFTKSSNSKQELQNKQRLVTGEVMMCVGSIPRLIRSPSHTPFTFGVSVEPKIKVIWCLR